MLKNKIVIQENIAEGKNPSYSATVFLTTIGNDVQAISYIHFQNAFASVYEKFLNKNFDSYWGELTADKLHRFAKLEGSFETPDVALAHTKNAIVKFFNEDYFDSFDLFISKLERVFEGEEQEIAISAVSEN